MQEVVEVNCTTKVLFYFNILAGVLFFYGAIERFAHCFGGAGFNLFFFIVTIYFVIGIIILFVGVLSLNGLAKDNKFSVYVRTYFNFVDNKLGLGIFMVFLTCIMIEIGGSTKVFVIITSVINYIIAAVNIFFGCQEDSIDFPQNPFEDYHDWKKEGDIQKVDRNEKPLPDNQFFNQEAPKEEVITFSKPDAHQPPVRTDDIELHGVNN